MKGKGPQKLGDVLSRLLQKRRYARPLALEGLRKAWSEAAGARFSSRSRVAQFRDGILTIEVASATQRYELEAFAGPELLGRLQADDSIPSVRRLVFRVGNVTS